MPAAALPAQPSRPRTAGRYPLHPVLVGVEDLSRRRVGDANPRGRFLRAEGMFRLRADLVTAGDISFADALADVLVDWDVQVAAGGISDDAVDTYRRQLTALASLLVRLGQPTVSDIDSNTVTVWCLMPDATGATPTLGTAKTRRAAARTFFETAFRLGITDANPAKSVEFPGSSDRYVHAFTNAQIRHLQTLAPKDLRDTRTPCALALVMSGAASEELAFTTVLDVDLPNRQVWLNESGYRRTPRWITLYDDWCVRAVQKRVADIVADPSGHGDPTNPWLTYQPHPTKANPDRQSASGGGVLITDLMKRAGLWEKGVTRVESIREWLAADIFEETGSIEQIAIRLGMASLDAAAHLVGYDWQTALGCPDPAPAHRHKEDGSP